MTYGIGHYTRSWHGDLGTGKRPDELSRPDRTSELLTAAEAARLVGMSSGQIRELARTGRLPFELKSGRYYFRRGDVERLRGAP